MQGFISGFKDFTRPLRLYYPTVIRLLLLRKIILLVDYLITYRLVKIGLINKIESVIVPCDLKSKIYVYPYYLRMLAARTYSLMRSKLLPAKSPKLNNMNNIVLQGLDKEGHCNKAPLQIPIKTCEKVISFFSNQPSYFGHGYDASVGGKKESLASLKRNNQPLPKYISYSYGVQFNCFELLDLIIQPTIIDIAHSYLGCIPKIEYINTFWTLPSDEVAWLSDFHRDMDDYLCLTVIINWTNTIKNNSGTRYIKGTHRPSPELTVKLKDSMELIFSAQKINSLTDEKMFDLFRASSFPGYQQNTRYENIFSKPDDYLTSSGRQGTICFQNNEGLHCGPKFEGERLISWVRYGNSGGVPGRTVDMQDVAFLPEHKDIIRLNEYGFLLEELFS